MVDFTILKKYLIRTLIGSFVACALLAVIAVLIGDFNGTLMQALFSIFMLVLHSLAGIALISVDKRKSFDERLDIFLNALFSIIPASFIVSTLGIWELFNGEIVGDFYQVFFLLGFAALHLELLTKALNKENYIDKLIYVNFGLIGFVVLMMTIAIFEENPFGASSHYFYRIMAAAIIIDGTISILVLIYYKLYLQKNPPVVIDQTGTGQVANPPQQKKWGVGVWIMIIYLIFQVGLPILFVLSIIMGV